MTRRDRRSDWRAAVYAPRPGMTNGTRVLLLRLLEDMDADGVVSVPRSKLAASLGVAPARVTERINLAYQLGFLDVVRRGRPGVTSVYQATVPSTAVGTEPVPLEVPNTGPTLGTELVPQIRPISGKEVRMYQTQVVEPPEDDSRPAVAPLGEERSNDEQGCPTCDDLARAGITSGCLDHYIARGTPA